MAIRLSKNGKRLGRPPKNSGMVFISAIPQTRQKEEEVIVNPDDAIECELVSVPQYSHMKSEDLKDGRYMTSIYSIENFGTRKWVIGAYLKADWNKFRVVKNTDKQIIEKCVNYLNSLGKKKRKYGNLQLLKFNFINKNGQELAVVELITDERKNENFWGEGEKM